jgi:hypothetical protein
MDELPKYLQSLRHPEAFVPLVLGLSLIYLALANDESRTRFALFGLGGLFLLALAAVLAKGWLQSIG